MKIHNVVAHYDFGVNLDLHHIAVQTMNAEYNPAKFPGLIVRIRHPCATALMFRSGRVVMTGTKTETDCDVAAKKFARLLFELNYFHVTIKDYKICNIIATNDDPKMVKPTDLNLMAKKVPNCKVIISDFFFLYVYVIAI